MRIAIDAMGGDAGPSVIVDGALVAARHLQVGLLLVGDAAAIEAELARHPVASLFRRIDVQIIDAPERVEMGESPAMALRRKPRASIRVAADAVKGGRADALFSAGHTGASVMAAHAAFGLLPGVDRPALATIKETSRDALHELLLTPAAAMAGVTARRLDAGEAAALAVGRPLVASGEAGPVAAIDPDGRLLAVVEDERGQARPRVVLA